MADRPPPVLCAVCGRPRSAHGFSVPGPFIEPKPEERPVECDGSGEIRWLANPPDPQTEESAPCPGCRNCESPPTGREREEYLVDRYEHDPDSPYFRRPDA